MSSLAEKIDLWGFEADLLVFKDGCLGFGIKIEPVDISFQADDEISDFHEKLKSFLSPLPDEVQFQFVKNFTKPSGFELRKHEELAFPSCEAVAKELARDRVSHFKEKIDSGQLSSESLCLFVRMPKFSEDDVEKNSKRHCRRAQLIESQVKKANLLCDSILDSLAHLGLKSKQMRRHEIFKHLFSVWNPDRDVAGHTCPRGNIIQSLLFSDVMIDRSGFTVGTTFHRVLSLKNLPAETYAGMGEVLSGLPIDSTVYVTIRKPDQGKENEKLKTQRRLSYAMVSGAEGVRDLEGEEKFNDIENILEDVVRGDEQIFEVSLNVVLRSKNEDELESQKAFVLSKIRDLAGSEAMVETAAAFPIFAGISPPNSKTVERVHRLKTSNLADFLPVYGNWRGHKTPSVLFKNRSDEIFSFDPFSEQMTNANQLISGGSGSGKSYLTNKIFYL